MQFRHLWLNRRVKKTRENGLVPTTHNTHTTPPFCIRQNVTDNQDPCTAHRLKPANPGQGVLRQIKLDRTSQSATSMYCTSYVHGPRTWSLRPAHHSCWDNY